MASGWYVRAASGANLCTSKKPPVGQLEAQKQHFAGASWTLPSVLATLGIRG